MTTPFLILMYITGPPAYIAIDEATTSSTAGDILALNAISPL